MSLAIEKMSADAALARMPDVQHHLDAILGRVGAQMELAPGASILDVGAAQGLLVACLRRMGYDALGVDPWPAAVETAKKISEEAGLETRVVDGSAEQLPVADASQDLVIAISVMEHVDDPAEAINEAARVLRPGGGFYFYTMSARSPRQNEIRRFPMFGWYPKPVKKRIMDWASSERPALVNHTMRPAYHWYTPSMTERLARDAGFSGIRNRWQLRAGAPGSGRAERLLASNPVARFAADVAIEDCAFLLLK